MSAPRHEVRLIHVPCVPGANLAQLEEALNEGFDMLACVPVTLSVARATPSMPPVMTPYLVYTLARELPPIGAVPGKPGRKPMVDTAKLEDGLRDMKMI